MSSIFPMIQPSRTTAADISELPLYREVAWDFAKDIPIYRDGNPVTISGAAAVKTWIWRALRTARYQHEIYSWDYGSELESLVGQAYTPALKEAEAPRYLRECLLTNPYITEIKNISVSFEDGRLSVGGTVETIYGEVSINAVV